MPTEEGTPIKYRPIKESSQILEIGWSPVSKELRVLFKSTGTTSLYSYSDVPGDIVANLLYAESVGRYFGAFVKPKFRCMKLNAQGGVEKIIQEAQ